jgi:hypothetical protein
VSADAVQIFVPWDDIGYIALTADQGDGHVTFRLIKIEGWEDGERYYEQVDNRVGVPVTDPWEADDVVRVSFRYEGRGVWEWNNRICTHTDNRAEVLSLSAAIVRLYEEARKRLSGHRYWND